MAPDGGWLLRTKKHRTSTKLRGSLARKETAEVLKQGGVPDETGDQESEDFGQVRTRPTGQMRKKGMGNWTNSC